MKPAIRRHAPRQTDALAAAPDRRRRGADERRLANAFRFAFGALLALLMIIFLLLCWHDPHPVAASPAEPAAYGWQI